MKRLLCAIGPAVVLFLVGCGGGPTSTFNCDSVTGNGHTCVEYENVSADVSGVQANCTQRGGKLTLGTICNHTGAIGGCKVGEPGTSGSSTTWYFDLTTSMIMSMCSAYDGTFIPQ